MPILTTTVPNWHLDLGRAIRVASKARGISPARMVYEIISLRRGRQMLTWKEYFLYGAHQPWHTAETRSEFVGEAAQLEINAVLTPAQQSLQGLVADKLLTDLVLTRAGIPVAPIRAIAVAVESDAPYPVLRGVSELDRFLAETPLPIFGKPVHGSRSLAAVSIIDRFGDDLELGDGRRVRRSELAVEILHSSPAGYLFQELIGPHPDLAGIIGPVIGTVRVVTLRVGAEIVPLYAALKMPGANAMVDDVASLSSMVCAVDHLTGRIIRAQDRSRLGGTELVTNPVTGVKLPGSQVPLWPEVMTLARNVHRLLNRQGVVGGDFAITPYGPLVIELNANPLHSMYQKSHARGLWNPELAPILTEALAGFGHRTATRKVPYP